MRTPPLVAVAFTVTLCASGSFAQSATPAPPATADCLVCHGESSATRADGRSVTVLADTFTKSIHGGLACVDCHADLAVTSEWPHPEKLKKVSCATCHEEPVSAFQRSVHHESATRTANRGATCVDCHGTHDIKPSSDPSARTHALNLPQTCAVCHGGQHLLGPPGEVAEDYRESVHGRAVEKAGLLVAANCSSCHGSHDVRRKSDAESPVHRSRVAQTCARCHQGILPRYAASVHGSHVAQGDIGAAVCSDCHTSHRIQRHETEAWRLDVIKECGTCHVNRIATYRDTYHGKVTDLGFTRVAACADCHGSHDILPASNPASMVSPARVVETCRQCHANANANFAKYDPHANKHDPERSAALYWTARLMQILLAGVFLFFGTHTLLWFPRSYWARRERRRAMRSPPEERQS